MDKDNKKENNNINSNQPQDNSGAFNILENKKLFSSNKKKKSKRKKLNKKESLKQQEIIRKKILEQTKYNPSQNRQIFKNATKTFKGMDSTFTDTKNFSNDILGNFGKILLIGGAIIGGFIAIKNYVENLEIYEGEFNESGGTEFSGLSTGKTSEKMKNQIKSDEGGFKELAYPDAGGYSIGYGHHGQVDGKPIYEGQRITKAQAEALFEQDVLRAENRVKNQLKKADIRTPISQNMFDAMVNYVFNAGSLGDKFLAKLKKGDYEGACAELEVGEQNKDRMARIRQTFASDIGPGNVLKSGVSNLNTISSNTPTGNASGNRVTSSSLQGVGDVYDVNGLAKTYGQGSNITSHTKLTSGTNQYYDANGKGTYGTFMGYGITSGIGKRSVENGSSWHRGLDLSFSYGTPVKAFASGKVTFVHNSLSGGFGRYLLIDDANKFRHVYGHLSKIVVKHGQYVNKGDLIAYSGASGQGKEYCYAAHLHYGIWRPGTSSDKAGFVDPRTYVYPDEVNTQNYGEGQNKPPQINNPNTKPSTQNPSTNNPKTQTLKSQPKQTSQQTQKPNNQIVVNPKQSTKQNNDIYIGKPGVKMVR